MYTRRNRVGHPIKNITEKQSCQGFQASLLCFEVMKSLQTAFRIEENATYLCDRIKLLLRVIKSNLMKLIPEASKT